MSKKLVKGTIKIASVGMAAVMATTPMATLAADADVVSSDAQPTVEDTQTNQADEKQEIKEAAVAVADAQTAVEGANDLMDTALDSNEAMGEGAITELPTATIPEDDVDAVEGELEDLAENISDMKDANTEADAAEAERLYGIKMSPMSDVKDMDAVILAVAHKEFAGLTVADVDKYFKDEEKLLLDIKGVFNKKEYEAAGYRYWRL
jgi:hypothetical protein